MKKFSILIAVTLSFLSCNHKNSFYISQSFTSGKWHITDYKKGNNEKKNPYTGFKFTFSRDYHVLASGNNHTYTGDWSVLESDVTDDAPVTDIDFNILFTDKTGLSGLNGEWTIVKKTDNFLSLIHMDTENTDFLIFEK